MQLQHQLSGKPAFSRLHQSSQPTVSTASSPQLTSILTKHYNNAVALLHRHLQNVSSISITSDAATLSAGDPYVCVTAHFLSERWKLVDVVLGVYYVEKRQTDEYVADLID